MISVVVKIFCLIAVTCALPRHHESNLCSQGAEYWCQNEKTATECGVLEFCKLTHSNEMAATDAKPIQIDLYYEAFCGGCRKFILEQLYPTYQKLYSTGIFEINLYPYGNAHESQKGDKWVFDCQHGEEECQMNLIETCALHLLSHPDQFMPYINCVENKPSIANAQKCAQDLKVDWEPISKCFNGSEGNFLEHQVAQKTEALVPKHTYVPWIVADGHHDETMQVYIQTGLQYWLCEHYKGTKPKECDQVMKNEKICYKDRV